LVVNRQYDRIARGCRHAADAAAYSRGPDGFAGHEALKSKKNAVNGTGKVQHVNGRYSTPKICMLPLISIINAARGTAFAIREARLPPGH